MEMEVVKRENDGSMLPVNGGEALAMCEKCAAYAPGSKSLLDAAERARANVAREVLSQMPNAALAMQAHSLGDLYQVVGDVELQQLKDGTYTVILRDSNGKITEHAKLTKASGGFKSAALFGYQALNAVIGQANMMSIAQSLKDIQEGIEESKERDYVDAAAQVESASLGLKTDILALPEGQRKLAAVPLMHELRTGLMKLIAYGKIEVEHMPNLTEIGFWDNWGLKSGTKPEQAKRRFLYIVNALDTICRGIVQYSLSEVFLSDGEQGTSVDLMRRLKDLVSMLMADGKVKLVPMLGSVDPIKKTLALSESINEAANALEKCFNQKSPERVLIPVRGNYLKEVANG